MKPALAQQLPPVAPLAQGACSACEEGRQSIQCGFRYLIIIVIIIVIIIIIITITILKIVV